MLRSAALVVVLLATTASANPRGERPMQLEVGVNTRHYASAHQEADVAFRGTDMTEDPSLDAGTAFTTSLRFTGKTRGNTFLGVEAEAGTLIGIPHSNIAGAYGVAGLRQDLGRLRVAAELVAGRRWVRYEVVHATDASTMIAEPRVRGDLWLGPQVTLGGAVGATIGDRSVWMAGIYIGLHSGDFDR